MSNIQELINEIRTIKKELALERSRRNQTLVTGVIKEVKGSKVRIEIGEDDEGKPLLSPWIRMAQNTGKRGSGVSKFTKCGVGESVLIVSPNGRIGSMSAAQPWISTEDDPSPGVAENDGDVSEIGNAKDEQRNGFRSIKVGDTSITMDGTTITITGNVQINGEVLKHNAKSISDTHKHTGVIAGGDQTDVPV